MYSQCPRCRTIFMLAPAALAAARGDTVCGHCGTLFNSLLTLTEFPPDADQRDLPEHPDQLPAPALYLPVVEPARDPVSSFDPDRDQAESVEDLGPPSFVPEKQGATSRNVVWWSVAAVLALLLSLQLLWADRARWAADASTRNLMQRVCASLGCELPLSQDLTQLALTSREIRPHPSVPGALLISATIRNDADFAQRFPVVRIRLSDLQEHLVAARSFAPADYLIDDSDARRGLAAQATAVLVFEVADPGREAVAFEFAFE